MSYQFNDILTNITQSSTAMSQKLTTTSQNISQIQPKISDINNRVQLTPNWGILKIIQSKITNLVKTLDTSKDEARLAKLQHTSSLEDTYVIAALIGFILSLFLLKYLAD